MNIIEFIAGKIADINSEFKLKYEIIDSKSENSKISFDCSKIITSLVSSGMPLLDSIKVLFASRIRIFDEHKSPSLKTAEIRDYVRSSIHCLEADGTTMLQCQEWGDTYVRKYGNPAGKISIIHRNGDLDHLDFDYINNSLLPGVLSDICALSVGDVVKVFSNNALTDMANELMRMIQDLGIYRINHRTLVLLSRDRATQPPHPWLPSDPSIFDNVRYDIERAESHLSNMEYYLNRRDVSQARNNLRECVHHASSAILSFYSEYLGCGDMAAFHNLREILRSLDSADPAGRLSQSKVHLLKHDIRILDISIDELKGVCTKLNHFFQIIYQDDAISESLAEVKKLYAIATGLVSGRSNLKNDLELVIKSNGQTKGKQYEDIVFTILSLCPHFKCRNNARIKGKQIDVLIEHSAKNEEFDGINKYIFVECKNTGRKTDVEVVEKLGARIRERAVRFCNSGIIVAAKGFTKGAKDEALKLFDAGIVIILLSNRDLFEMIEGDVLKYLSTKIHLLFMGLTE